MNSQNVKHAIKHRVITNGPPVKARVKSFSPEKLTFIELAIDRLLDYNVLVPSASPYASPIHIFAKHQSGKFRMVGDYRKHDNITQPDRFLFPLLHDFSDKMQGYTVFSKLYCLKGYHQIPMAEVEAQKTANITPVGLYQYNECHLDCETQATPMLHGQSNTWLKLLFCLRR